MSTHRTFRTKLTVPFAALGVALSLHACAEPESVAPEPSLPMTGGVDAAEAGPSEPGDDDDEAPDASVSSDAARAPTPPQGELDGVPVAPPVVPPPQPTPTDTPVPPPVPGSRPSIVTVSANGTGCPRGTWTATTTADRGVELRLTGYTAALEGPSLTTTARDCQLSLQIDSPGEGLTYAIESVTYEGHATLSASASAELLIRAYFQGDATEQSESSRAFRGPIDTDYQFVDQLDATRTVWAPCGVGRALNLSTTLRLASGGDAALNRLSLGTITAVRLAMRECSAEAANTGVQAGDTAASSGGDPAITSVMRTESR